MHQFRYVVMVQNCEFRPKLPNAGSLGLFTTPTPLPHSYTPLPCPPLLLSGPTSKLTTRKFKIVSKPFDRARLSTAI